MQEGKPIVVAVAGKTNAKPCANWVAVDLAARLNKEGKELVDAPVSAAQLGGLIARIGDNTISNNIAKKVFDALWNGEGTSADEVIEKQGLKQITDSNAIAGLVDSVLAANPAMVAEFKAGKEKAFNALVGQVSQLVNLGLVFLVQVSLFSLVQPFAGVLGFQGCHLGRFRVGLQGREVGLGVFQVDVRLVRARRQANAQGQQGRNHDCIAHNG